MARQAVVGGEPPREREYDAALRPKWLREVIGQKKVVDRLGILLNSVRKTNETLPHILFDGPPGLGKTTFATVLPNELGTAVQLTSGPALSKPADMLPFLTNAEERSILFIDEIHRMPRVVEEFIYPAMEDYRVDIVLGEGVNARTLSMKLKPFTLIGATTRSGMLTGPMRDRFKVHEHLDFYSVEELSEIIRINAAKLNTLITPDASLEMARRSRGTPRIANSRLTWTRHYAISESDGRITLELAQTALDMAEVDRDGLDKQDRRYLETLIDLFNGGPTGIEAMSATMSVATDTLSDEVEPYLLREQYIIRSPRGRMATRKAYLTIGRTPKGSGDSPRTLFDEEE